MIGIQWSCICFYSNGVRQLASKCQPLKNSRNFPHKFHTNSERSLFEETNVCLNDRLFEAKKTGHNCLIVVSLPTMKRHIWSKPTLRQAKRSMWSFIYIQSQNYWCIYDHIRTLLISPAGILWHKWARNIFNERISRIVNEQEALIVPVNQLQLLRSHKMG